MSYDMDSISILKQSSVADCNYLWAAKDGSDVLQCFIEKSDFSTQRRPTFIKENHFLYVHAANYYYYFF